MRIGERAGMQMVTVIKIWEADAGRHHAKASHAG
jgi:hypothetical protein